MISFDQPATSCPACGYVIDAATPLQGYAGPVAGDYSVCFNCATVLVFDDRGGLRLPTSSEALAAGFNRDLQRVAAAIRARQ